MRRLIRLFLFAIACEIAAAPAARAAQPAAPAATPAGSSQQGVLFLAIDDFTRLYLRLMFEAFSTTVAAAPNTPAVYFESLDALRFEHPRYFDDLRDWLRRKYQNVRIDLVVAISEDAVAFLADARGEPWPAAQVLFLEATSVRVDTRTALPQAGGILLDDHFVDMFRVMRTVVPDARHVALVYGASAIEIARWREMPGYVRKAGLEPIDLASASIEETLAKIKRLPEHSVVLLLAPVVDANGNALGPTQACEALSAAATVPLFTPGAQDLGCGSVGGLGRDWEAVGRVLAEETVARLARPSTGIIGLPVARYTTLAFDDRQLRRWGIPESRLPPGAVVRFREPSIWRDYRPLVLTALGLTVVQSLLIAGLVFEHRRRRRAEVESRRHLAAMAHLDRRAAMGELATSLAHELNQPLNAILQNAGVAQMMLAATTVPPALGEMAEILGDIRNDDIRASETIRRMRQLLQKRELEAQPVDLNDVAQETVAIVRPDARSREIELHLDLGTALPPVAGDRVHLQQVVLNLLMNALDAVSAMPADRRRVQVVTSDEGGEVRLAVLDAGTGIAPDGLSKIFEPFFTTKRSGAGMGMGLAIARSIVEAHAGRMGAENNTGGGATVWFRLPVAH
jgi:signal transduction histidine kinase